MKPCPRCGIVVLPDLGHVCVSDDPRPAPVLCGADILGSGVLCVRKHGHRYPEIASLHTADEKLAAWLDAYDKPYRVPLSPATLVELKQRADDERPAVRLGDHFHGLWCEMGVEENRWWQAFCAALTGRSIHIGADVAHAAGIADEAIAEAKKRGRL